MDSMNITKHPASVVGTYANRMIHKASNQLSIGPHLIDPEGNVRTIKEIVDTRLTATCEHLTDPENMIYILGMEGEFFEINVHTLAVKHIGNLLKELAVGSDCRPHFKDAYSDHGRVVVANNSYYASDYDRGFSDGRLAEWDGKSWKVLERTQFNTTAGRKAGDLGQGILRGWAGPGERDLEAVSARDRMADLPAAQEHAHAGPRVDDGMAGGSGKWRASGGC